MGVLDKFLEVLHLNPDDDDEYYNDDYDYEDDYEDEPVKPKKSARKERKEEEDEEDYPEKNSYDKPKSTSKVTPIRPVKKTSSSSGLEVCVIKPTSVNEAQEITETLLSNRAVILNVEGLDVEVAQRIIDFTCGSCFAISGNFQKISSYIFIITPSSVDISGDFLGLVDSFESRGIQTEF